MGGPIEFVVPGAESRGLRLISVGPDSAKFRGAAGEIELHLPITLPANGAEPARRIGVIKLPAFYQAKRDLFRQGLEGSRLRLLPSTGSYFQCVDISAVSDLSEADFCQWLTREIGVAAIPLSAFYGNGFDQKVVRFCFAKKDDTLREALKRLARL